MDPIAAQTIAIFKARADSALDLALDTRLPELDIESLDLALILLDIEDTFGIDFRYDPEEEADAFATVGAVVERVRALMTAKRARLVSAGFARGRSLWVAAGARA